jgi:hypothetical protein
VKIFDVEIGEGGGHFFVMAGTLEMAVKKAVIARKKEYPNQTFTPIVVAARMLEGRGIR